MIFYRYNYNIKLLTFIFKCIIGIKFMIETTYNFVQLQLMLINVSK